MVIMTMVSGLARSMRCLLAVGGWCIAWPLIACLRPSLAAGQAHILCLLLAADPTPSGPRTSPTSRSMLHCNSFQVIQFMLTDCSMN
jgi:hypothetical protein